MKRKRGNGHAREARRRAHAPAQYADEAAERKSRAGERQTPDVAALERFLHSLGVDPERDPEYSVTAALLAELLTERTAGLREEPPVLRPLPYSGRAGETVAIEGIGFYGLCPHHLVPYIGQASVRFTPRGRICGAGALVRLVRQLAQVPRLQENLTQAVADVVERALEPHGVEVTVRARHLCMELKGSGASARLRTEARRGDPIVPGDSSGRAARDRR
jgi:GTP cyclohydrolase I